MGKTQDVTSGEIARAGLPPGGGWEAKAAVAADDGRRGLVWTAAGGSLEGDTHVRKGRKTGPGTSCSLFQKRHSDSLSSATAAGIKHFGLAINIKSVGTQAGAWSAPELLSAINSSCKTTAVKGSRGSSPTPVCTSPTSGLPKCTKPGQRAPTSLLQAHARNVVS